MSLAQQYNNLDTEFGNSIFSIPSGQSTKSAAVFRCTDDGRLIYYNNSFSSLFKLSSEPLIIGRKASSFCTKKKNINSVFRSLRSNNLCSAELEFRKEDGENFNGDLSAIRIKREGKYFIEGTIKELPSDEEFSNYQKVLLKISSTLLDADLDNIDGIIVKSLGVIGELTQADRVQMHNYNRELMKCVLSYEWNVDKKSDTHNHDLFPMELMSDLIDVHSKGYHVFLRDIDQLDESSIKEVLKSQNVKSSLAIPMRLRNDLVGFLSFDYISKYAETPGEDLVSSLKLFANMLANVSSRSKDHSRLKRLTEDMISKSKRHKDFSFITSHNIRASAANLTAISELIDKDSSDRYFDMLKVTVKRLNQSIENINDILNLDYHHLIVKTSCNVFDSLTRVLQTLNHVVQSNQIVIKNKVHRKLCIQSIPAYLDNIFLHLISNAIKYGTNERRKSIKISSHQSSNWINLTISDDGPGFDQKKYASKLFKVGSRFHNDRCDGQGLGLFIVKQQVDSLGGKVDLKSTLGKGTNVKISFPVVDQKE